jgi:hypothetical protein
MKHQNEKRPLTRNMLFPLWAAFFAGILLFNCVGCLATTGKSESGKSEQAADEEGQNDEEIPMRIRIEANGKTTVFELNGSDAAKSLYAQLPLNIGVENYSSNEKIFYPPQKLDTTNTPLAKGGIATLAYYAPWGDVVMFYSNFNSGSSLYGLGKAIQGVEHISGMSGTLRITKEE